MNGPLLLGLHCFLLYASLYESPLLILLSRQDLLHVGLG